ncbi:hypothetical protein ACTFIW_006885 [Dictyostelium discoideum]
MTTTTTTTTTNKIPKIKNENDDNNNNNNNNNKIPIIKNENENENNNNWEELKLFKNKLDLKKTLFSAQSFIWKEIVINEIVNEYVGVIGDNIIVLRYKEGSEQDIIEYKFIDSKKRINHDSEVMKMQDRISTLQNYFYLDLDINQLFKKWRNDDNDNDNNVGDSDQKLHQLNHQFRKSCDKFIGLRLTRQNPVDCLFSFICSQNNNVSRITSLVNKLIVGYGSKITDYNHTDYYKFPTLSQLSNATVEELNVLGFGYRSKYIVESCKQVIEKGGEQWLNQLKLKPHLEVQKELTTLMGVGKKVADCVSLMSMDNPNAVAIDTHIYQISKKYLPSLANSSSSLTPKLYQDISNLWESIFGDHAGWAQTILFANELSVFKEKSKNIKIKKEINQNNNNNNNNNNNIKIELKNEKENLKRKIITRSTTSTTTTTTTTIINDNLNPKNKKKK